MPEADDEPTAQASLRTVGRTAAVGAVGGAVHEAAPGVRKQVPAKSALRPIVAGVAGAAGAMYSANELLARRQAVIKRWTDKDKPAPLGKSVGIGFAVATVGWGIGRGFLASRRRFVKYFGTGPTHALIGRTVNNAVWAAGGYGLYSAGMVARIAKTNEKIEPAYSTPPDSPGGGKGNDECCRAGDPGHTRRGSGGYPVVSRGGSE